MLEKKNSFKMQYLRQTIDPLAVKAQERGREESIRTWEQRGRLTKKKLLRLKRPDGRSARK